MWQMLLENLGKTHSMDGPASSWSQLLSMMGLEAVEFRTELYGFGTELWKHDDIQKYIVYIVYT